MKKTPFQKALQNGKKYLTDQERNKLPVLTKKQKHFLFILLITIPL